MQIGRTQNSFNRDWNRIKQFWEANIWGWPGQALQRCGSVLWLCRFNPWPPPRHGSCPTPVPPCRTRTRGRRHRALMNASFRFQPAATAEARWHRDRIQLKPYSEPLPCCRAPSCLCSTLDGWGVFPWWRPLPGQLPDSLGITSQAAGIYQTAIPPALLQQPVFIRQRWLGKEE